MHKRASEIIETLELVPHKEGGYYKETYRSGSKLVSPENNKIRNAVTDIYFLLLEGQVSRFHKVLHDEIWHFYEGAPLTLVEIESDSLSRITVSLGEKSSVPKYKHCIKGGNWQAAYPTSEYSLVGCTVAPGFDFSDFEFLKENESSLLTILGKYPDLASLI